MKKHKELPKERMGKYWTCPDCAKAKKWKFPRWPVTCTSGLCGWCDRQDETGLIPTCDFTYPGNNAIWD